MPVQTAALLYADRTTNDWVLPSGEVIDPIPTPPGPGEPYSYTLLGKKPTSATATALTGQDLSGSSGGVHSRLHSDTCWVHSDRGTYLYALGLTASGGYLPLKKAHTLTGVDIGGSQWEDSAYDVAHGSRWWVANCGGNTPVNSFKAFRFPELASLADPTVVEAVAAETFYFKYPGSEAWDCETMLCDPIKGQVMFLTKEPVGVAQIYAAPQVLSQRTAAGSQVNALTPITSGSFTKYGNLTGGDFTPDGTAIYVRNNNTRGTKYAVQRDSAGWVTGFSFVENFTLPALPNINGAAVTAETLFCHRSAPKFYIGAEGVESPMAEVLM